LRLKLVIALLLPMLLVTVLIGDRVSSSFDDRSVAEAQQDEAARLDVIANFADAVGAESVVTNDPTGTREQLAAARTATDVAFQQIDESPVAIDEDLAQRIGDRYADLVDIRAGVGDRPSDISLRFQLEAYVDPDMRPSLSDSGERVPVALARLYRLPTEIVDEFEFAQNAIVDVETAQLLADYELVQRLRDDHVQEVSVLLQLAATPRSLIDGAVLAQYRARVTETDFSRNLIFELAAQNLQDQVSASQNSPAGSDYSQLRADADRTGPDVERMTDTAAVNRAGSVVTSQYAQVSDDVVESIRQQAEDTAGGATTSLVLVLLAGAWMLVIAAMILRLLYRAIRAPLKRLTEESQHIANVELPYVVSAMRGGDLDEIPVTTDLVAEADDEIGDLVHAFNDMHRTAVELAAEQAGSRRVVADMFVNLGRRNQRLVNRLLKRLTILERDERDPDKLAGLYEIDHVVTRMRRNAESLLVLAGASQSRKWDRPVEIYNIAQAALSEVEGYERVEIVASDEFEIHGDVVSDLTHLLAEVVENAVSFSPPSVPVEMSIRRSGEEHLVIVTDLGVGMNEAQLDEANERIRTAGVEEETPSEFLGHYVIGRLAARHGIEVHLSTGAQGRGIVAEVHIPVGAVVPAAGQLVEDFDEGFEYSEPADTAPTTMSASDAPAVTAIEMTTDAPVPSPSLEPATAAATDASDPDEESAAPDWNSVDHDVRRPAAPGAFDGQQRRVPSSSQPLSGAGPAPSSPPPPEPVVEAPAPAAAPVEAPAPTIDPTPTPAPVPAPVSAPEPAAAPAASASPTPASARSEITSSLAQLATPTPGASFDYPPSEQIDPRQREHTRPAAAAAPTVPAPTGSADLDAARDSANDAVEGALSAFGSARRTPGASLPDTSLTAAISGRMTLDLGDSPTPRPAPEPAAQPDVPASEPLTAPTPDPSEIRFQLSGFQSGIRRADQEN